MATVFLDLDGTLVDPKPGITRAFAHALAELGHDTPQPDALEWVIGPALIDSFAKCGVSDPEAALAAYRASYTGGAMFDCAVYPGIQSALATLREAGHILHLATAKPHVYARKITAHFGLAQYLAREFGPELDGTRNDKAELLAYALSDAGENPKQCVMVGDRVYDIRAARAVGMPAIAVKWGYGNTSEHEHAHAVCATPTDLPSVIDVIF